MLTKLRTLASLYRQAGFRWSAFRLAYAFRLRTGLIRLQMPQYKWETRPLETWLKKNIPSTSESYTQWRKSNSPKFFFDLPHVMLSDSEASRTTGVETLRYRSGSHIWWNPQTAIDEAERILNGEIKYFAHEFQQTGFPPNWHKASATLQPPSSAAGTPPQANLNKHWSQISDDGEVDIKFIWEPNRFSFVYTLVRAYASSQDEKYAEAFWKLILDWAERNPPNTGPNWMDGQEISLRLMAWTFGFYAFLASPSSTPERIVQFTAFVAAQAERIYKNIDYAFSTQSNHTISEACGLWLVGILFPELKDSDKYLSLGRNILEEEAVKQIFPDGSYSMYSLNYHRFILQIYFYAMRLGELNDIDSSLRAAPFAAKQSPRLSENVYRVVTKSVEYLYQLVDPQTGQMPVCGSNDGALVLPLNNCDFTDYRPLLQLGSFITKGEKLFDSGEWDEDLFWLCNKQITAETAKGAKEKKNFSDLSGLRGDSFPNGGIYILRNTNSKAVIRCTDFQSRPSHADQLHVDLWIRGQNIACDAGTYLYSGEGIWRNGFAHTSAHNTVIVDSKDQMKMVSRFTWTDWAKGKVLQHKENIWQGEHDGYKPVTHKRTVMMLDGDRWLVIDNLIANELHQYALHWLLNDFPFEQKDNLVLLDLKLLKYKMQVGILDGDSAFSIVRADPNSARGWRSRYYGHKEPAISAMLETNQSQACFWTFFGFESDLLELDGHSLRIKSPDINSTINLDTLGLNTPL